MNTKIQELFGKRFSLLNKLCVTYYETSSTRKERDAIYLEVKKEMERFNDTTESAYRLENIVNEYMDGIMQKIRTAYPNFTEEDYRLLCPLFSGFSGKAINALLGININTLYSKKSRLKKRISESDSPYKETILSLLQ